MGIIGFTKSLTYRMALARMKMQCRDEFETQQFSAVNERPIEFAFVFRQLTRLYPRAVLDVGTGLTALPHLMRSCGFLVTAIDNVTDYWPKGMGNRHYCVLDEDITQPTLKDRFNLITCVSVLEHIKNHEAAIRSMFALLEPGGHLVLTCPYNEKRYVENVYKLPESPVKDTLPFATQAFSRNEINQWLEKNSAELVEQEYWNFFTGDYWTCGERIVPPLLSDKDSPHQLTCLLLRKTS